MPGHDRELPTQRGHEYRDIHVEGGKSHFGDAYYFGRLARDCNLKQNTDCNPGLDSPLNRLPFAKDAPFNSYARQDDPTCLPNTRVDVLQEIYNWADGQDDRCIFWLYGLAGTGKSTIARTVARRYYEEKRLGASFFFSRGGGDVGHAGGFVTSIAVQLASHVPSLQHYICEAITERCDIANQSLRDQWRQLILRPLSKLDSDSCQFSCILLVVDALDECDNENNVRTILDLLAEARSLKTFRLRSLITSRPEVPIRYGFHQMPRSEYQDLILHGILPAIVDNDISIFLEHDLGLLGQERALNPRWPGEDVIKRLVRKAHGLFIWAATACRFIRDGRQFATERLDMILEDSSTSITPPAKHLDDIYATVLGHSIRSNYTDGEKEKLYSRLRHLLGSIIILFSPLSSDSLNRLLYDMKQDIELILEDLHAILDIPKDRIRPLRLHHPSFRDFLLNKERCGKFWVDEKQTHRTLADSCIRLMFSALRQDICGVGAPGVLVPHVQKTQVERCIPPEVQYACLYWVQHLQNSGAQLCDNDQVHQLLQNHLLHWFEALGWMQKVSEGILAIISLESIASVSHTRCTFKVSN